MVGLTAPDKVDLTFTYRVESIQPDTSLFHPLVAPPRGMTSNGKRARGTACAYQASEALAETGGPVLSLIPVNKE